MASPQYSVPSAAPKKKIPALEQGDHLTRNEFERRYDAMPRLKKAELIEGVVYMPSPVRLDQHADQHAALVTCLGIYQFATPGVREGDNGTIRLDMDNEPQPDVFLLIDPKKGGQARISEDGYVELAPELVAEVSSSSVSFDLHTKFRMYQRNGVREYLVWRVLDEQIDWYVLRDGTFQLLAPDGAGILRSEMFPGLWLDAPALLKNNRVQVMTILQQGLASPEHQAFLQKLQPKLPPA